jgi:hypothetical protein
LSNKNPKRKKNKTMARTMSVKIPVSSLIADIEKSIAKIDEAVANYASEASAYRDEMVEYEKALIAKAIEALGNPDNIGTDHNSPIRIQRNNYRNDVSVEFDIEALGFPTKPEEPVKPNQKEWFGREHQTRKEILQRNLKVLRMTTQEEVSASSYSSVMELI